MRVRAAGINFLDVLVRQGRYPQMPELPTVLGSEVAGEVDGRRVMALPRAAGGGYAEAVVVDESLLVPLPESASFEEGASFLLTFLTAWIPLTRRFAWPTARRCSCTPAPAASARRRSRSRSTSARASSRPPRPRRSARSASSSARTRRFRTRGSRSSVKADVVLDPVGGEVFSRSLATLNPLGAVVALGFAGGWWQPLDPAPLVGRNVGILGFYLGRLMRFRPDVVADAIAEIVALWESGAVKPLVGATYSLDDVADAHRLVEERRSVGKVVLVP